MKKILSLFLLGALGLASQAQAQSISAARAQAVNSTVTVRGIVTNGPELGVIRYLQDNVAGIAAYSSAPMITNLVPGDSVEITGTMKNYNGLLEIDPVTSVNVLARNKPLPAPKVVTAANAANVYVEQYEGMLVQITGNSSIKTTAGANVTTLAGNTTYRLNGVSGQDVRTNSASTGPNGIVNKPAPTNTFGLTGIMSQYTSTGTGGYQLLPRVYSDFDMGATPNVITAPYPTNITTSGFTINFKTQNAGSTRVDYGTSPTALNQNATSAASVTTHSIALSGLQPATVYYVQVTSTNSIGSSVSTVVPMITASNSTGTIKPYFNRSVNTAYGPANNAATTLTNAIDDTLVAYINRATQTIDLTMYGFNSGTLVNLPTALNNAKTRGVTVRLVIDDYGSQGLAGLNAAIPVVKRNTPRGIMHNKFVVIDANSTNPNKPIVWTGSTNYTVGQVNTDPNSAIVIQDQSLAKAFRMEFEEMFGNGTATGGVFGPAKADNTPHHFNIGGSAVELYFSPSDNVNSRLIETIGTANNDLHISTMLMTRSDIAVAIKNQIQANPGMEARSEMLMDDSTQASGPFMTVKGVLNNRIQLWKNTGGIFHHKYMVVDVGATSSDPLVWVSSHNWSNSANNENDENTLVIHNFNIANQYYQEHAKRIQDLNKGFTAVNFQLLGLGKDLNASVKTVKVYPNPNAGSFNVSVTDKNIGSVRLILTDVAGKKVYENTVKVNGAEDIKIETNNLPKGIYNLQLNSSKGMQMSKVVVY
ncbi:phospholipase D-like domain-containing protein [Adhaeribacter soli]|uniref:phospholipase D n=1 Tax=Adhaeribacter soli TaxID=2607655 RepID=A0A5N1J2I1_9BACT|nr:phospholipase D-like domain-containing protein [Adhaeribacter soli]KAA9338832.1 T9SS type A sorting domain-containing protein [Adhaeribacter soli]